MMGFVLSSALMGAVLIPFVSLVVALSLRRRVLRLEERLDRLSGVLKSGAASLQSPGVPRAESFAPPPAAPSTAQGFEFPGIPEKTPVAAPPPFPVLPAEPFPAPKPGMSPAADPFAPAKVASDGPPTIPAVPSMDWENFTGAKLFSWIGGVALFLGAVFFAKYSMDHGWISPALRIALGILLGAGAVVGGLALRGRTEVTAQTLAGAGASILFADIFAAHTLYGFLGPIETFVLLALVTALAFLLSVRLHSQYIALLALVGGFLVPPLVSTGVDRPLGLFGYITLLDLGLWAVVIRKEWGFLWGLAALGTVVMQWGWMDRFLTPEKLEVAAAIFIWFPVLFGWAREKADRLGKTLAPLGQSAGALALSAVLFAMVSLPKSSYGPTPLPLFAVLFLANVATAFLAARWSPGQAHHVGAGFFTFLGLLAWTERFFTNDTVALGLGAYLGFGLLHGAMTVVYSRRSAPRGVVVWGQLFPLFMLLPLISALLKNTVGTPIVWAGLFAINVVVLVTAVVTGFLWGALGALLLSFWAAGRWLRLLSVDGAAGFLVVVGGLAVLFFVAERWLFRSSEGGSADGTDSDSSEEPPSSWATLLPLCSALLPFLLLATAVEKWRPEDPSALFGLGALLLALLLGLARRGGKVVEWLTPIGLGCVVLLEMTWHRGAFSPDRLFPAVAWYGGFSGLFLALPFLAPKSFGRQSFAWGALALSGPAHLWLFYKCAQAAGFADQMGLLPLGWALVYVGILAALLQRGSVEEQRTPVAWVAGAALFFVSLIFPMQFEKQWITLGWALEGLALVALHRRLSHPGLKVWALGLLLLAFVRLAFNPAVLQYHPRTDLRIWNWYLYAYGVTAVCLLLSARRWTPEEERWGGVSPRSLLSALGGILLFLLMNIEIADAFSPGPALAFTLRGPLAQDMAMTLGWGVFGLGLLVLGLWKNGSGARWAGLGLLSVTVGKLFLHDVWRLPLLYRAGAFVGLAAVLMVGSFLYQKIGRDASRREGL